MIISNAANREEILDVCLTKSQGSFEKDLLWYLEEDVGSDHLPTVLEIKAATKSGAKPLKIVNWEKLHRSIESNVYEYDVHATPQALNHALTLLVGVLQENVASATKTVIWRFTDDEEVMLSKD